MSVAAAPEELGAEWALEPREAVVENAFPPTKVARLLSA
jgi:hypothetical protein